MKQVAYTLAILLVLVAYLAAIIHWPIIGLVFFVAIIIFWVWKTVGYYMEYKG
jgi:hypothetical protein